MPTFPPHPCAQPGCAALVPRGKARCPSHETKQHAAEAEQRGTAAERGYDHRWQKARSRFLNEHPLCAHCEKAGRVTAARVVDHIIAHQGDPQLFWDESNWEALCDWTSPFNCHGKKTSAEANSRKEVPK